MKLTFGKFIETKKLAGLRARQERLKPLFMSLPDWMTNIYTN